MDFLNVVIIACCFIFLHLPLQDAQRPFNALILVRNEDQYYVPTQVRDDVRTGLTFAVEKSQQNVYLCPATSENERNAVQVVTEFSPIFTKCLFEGWRKKTCETQPQPIISNKSITCGPDDQGTQYSFSYAICKPRTLQRVASDLSKRSTNQDDQSDTINQALQEKIAMVDLYSFCYDNTKKLLYTEHIVEFLEPDLRQNPAIIELSTNPSEGFYTIDDEFFGPVSEQLRQEYTENLPDDMMIKSMVPEEHMIFGNWKTITQNYLNAGLLRKDLNILMDFVDNRILEVAIRMNKVLAIHTTVHQNIWCKLVINYQASSSGTAIIYHNDSHTYPDPSDWCDMSENVETNVLCDVYSWPKPPEYDEIINAMSQYMLCCKISKKVTKLFSSDGFTYNESISLN